MPPCLLTVCQVCPHSGDPLGVTQPSHLTLAVKGWRLGRRTTFLGKVRENPRCCMCDTRWLPSLSSRQNSRPQLCLHAQTGCATPCPADIFAGRESEHEMIALWVNMEKSYKAQRRLASVSHALLFIVTLFHHLQLRLFSTFVCKFDAALTDWLPVLWHQSCGGLSSLPALMRAAGRQGVVFSSLRQTMQFKPASGMQILLPGGMAEN